MAHKKNVHWSNDIKLKKDDSVDKKILIELKLQEIKRQDSILYLFYEEEKKKSFFHKFLGCYLGKNKDFQE